MLSKLEDRLLKLEAMHSLKAINDNDNEIDRAIQAISDEELYALIVEDELERGCPDCINCDDPHLCRIIAEIGHLRRVES